MRSANVPEERSPDPPASVRILDDKPNRFSPPLQLQFAVIDGPGLHAQETTTGRAFVLLMPCPKKGGTSGTGWAFER